MLAASTAKNLRLKSEVTGGVVKKYYFWVTFDQKDGKGTEPAGEDKMRVMMCIFGKPFHKSVLPSGRN